MVATTALRSSGQTPRSRVGQGLCTARPRIANCEADKNKNSPQPHIVRTVTRQTNTSSCLDHPVLLAVRSSHTSSRRHSHGDDLRVCDCPVTP